MAASPLLLFYPTSPVHVRDFLPLRARLAHWSALAIVNPPLAGVSPGIDGALTESGLPALSVAPGASLAETLPGDAAVLLLGAVFEPFALRLLAWAMRRNVPVAAIEEVAQLGLNQADINNYDAPFDRLFVASADEFERFLALGYPRDMLRVSGLPAYERIARRERPDPGEIRHRLGIAAADAPIVYTTSPVRSHLAIHNKDCARDREAMLASLAEAARRCGRPLVVKLHPNEDREAVRQAVRRSAPGAVVVGREIAIDDLLAVAGVLVNRGNSQTCLEGVLRGVPVVVAANGLPTLFHGEDGIPVAEDPRALPELVERTLAAGPPATEAFRARHGRVPERGVPDYLADEIEALAAAPPARNESGWNWLVRSTLFVGDHQLALSVIRDAPLASPWQGSVAAALTAHLAGDGAAAIAAWRDCLDLDPAWFFPHYELAHGLLAAGESRAAIEHARQSIALHPPFHGLWHELPMRVVIMAAMRRLGRDAEAAAELAALERRELVSIVPELLIEKSALATRRNGNVDEALDAIERAASLLSGYSLDPGVDRELGQRALAQAYLVGEQALRIPDRALAAACHLRLVRAFPDDGWLRFACARVTLRAGAWVTGWRMLLAISAIPEAPREIARRALSPEAAARLLPHWPGNPGVRARPWTLLLGTAAWCLRGLLASGGKDWPHALAFAIMIGLFVPRHYLHRLFARGPVIP